MRVQERVLLFMWIRGLSYAVMVKQTSVFSNKLENPCFLHIRFFLVMVSLFLSNSHLLIPLPIHIYFALARSMARIFLLSLDLLYLFHSPINRINAVSLPCILMIFRCLINLHIHTIYYMVAKTKIKPHTHRVLYAVFHLSIHTTNLSLSLSPIPNYYPYDANW